MEWGLVNWGIVFAPYQGYLFLAKNFTESPAASFFRCQSSHFFSFFLKLSTFLLSTYSIREQGAAGLNFHFENPSNFLRSIK